MLVLGTIFNGMLNVIKLIKKMIKWGSKTITYWRTIFQPQEHPPWFYLGKDLWRKIILILVRDKKHDCSIGWFDFKMLWSLRATSTFFANLIDPRFCILAIYQNPYANICKYECIKCSLGKKDDCDRRFWSIIKNKMSITMANQHIR